MDHSITLITPELMRERGADAFYQGLGIDDHGLPPGSAARKDWQFGWHTARIERAQMCAAEQQLTEVA